MEAKSSLPPTNSYTQITHQPLKLKKPHDDNTEQIGSFTSSCSFDDSDKGDTQNPSASKTCLFSEEEIAIQKPESAAVNAREEIVGAEDNGRERLKRHKVEVAGRVWIPEMWGQEELLKDWINCSAFDAPFVPSRIMTARAALVREGRRALLVD
ncbi:uncharacterized protein LOC114751064 [Neltuma alba]|uniref:uncharacterized protein LOC114738488 n=1 Tax=Neltuma alba TaxID=207710 RepID=UPI0010A405E7|nr:uncharacterized protein LOC114738488 [Prosopis alba]XP_028795563.1 uncharacterized protein LOC114751064 [Prosopis alba]